MFKPSILHASTWGNFPACISLQLTRILPHALPVNQPSSSTVNQNLIESVQNSNHTVAWRSTKTRIHPLTFNSLVLPPGVNRTKDKRSVMELRNAFPGNNITNGVRRYGDRPCRLGDNRVIDLLVAGS